MSDEKKILLWVVSEMLSRFAGTFSIANHGYVFELFFFPDAATASQALTSYQEHLGTSGEDCNWQIQLEFLGAEEARIQETLSRWLKCPFGHLDSTDSQIQDPPPLGELVMECFLKLGATHYWKVDVSSPVGQFLKPFYECSWDDFLIQTPDGFLFLHLGVSD